MADVSESELKEFKDALQLLESTVDGKVNVHEMGKLLRSVGNDISHIWYRCNFCARLILGIDPNDQELSSIIAELDVDKEGTIEFPDFLAMMTKKMKNKDSEHDLREAFQVLDEKGTGFVKTSELTDLLVNVMGESEDEVKAMFKEVDANKTGMVNYDDFIRLVLKWYWNIISFLFHDFFVIF